ncbi:hypothetical protein [Haloterrigena alkaliphila]|uniref:Uncharacterized protein n=1 Tax=Haloterrigena alkaliphila TaxID=2816475 RepID=A0A8A2VFE9_9EURY|nr:hypothetical protein [Haloterrigena alkaliphila]QSX00770.1 hypothetical protein J0X25_07375 [Haloterrigena alkaliphila]
MAAKNSTDETWNDPPELTERSEVPVYLPGTPTIGFAKFLERLLARRF